MPNAVANRALIAFGKESSYGGALASTTGKRMRILSEGIVHTPSRQLSNQIEPDRNRVEVMDLGFSASGPIEAELSYTDWEAVLRSVLCAGSGTADTPSAGVTRFLNGTNIESWYLEDNFTDVNVLKGIYGAVFNELTLTVEANKEVTLQLGVIAQKAIKVASTRFTTAISAPAADPVMRSGVDVAQLRLGGNAIPAAVQRLTLTFRNNFAPRGEIGQGGPQEMLAHAFEVTGSMLPYFPSASLYDDFVAGTAKGLDIKIGNTAGAFTIHLPAITTTTGTPVIPGQGQDVMPEMSFIAAKGLLDGVGCTAAIDVDPA